MSQASELLGARSAPHTRVVGAVSAAHFVSHYYILLLAPLLPFVRAEYGVSYTEIGLAFAAFNGVSAALQTPAGFLVDWLGARILLIAGLAIGAGAFMLAGLIDSFWVLVAMFALAGVGNTVYHPADYALLSHHVPPDRIGQAFSVHTFAGMLGSAVAPASLLMMQSLWGWRGAFIGAGDARLRRAARAAGGARQRGRNDKSARRARPTTRRRSAGGFCCRRRSCSICFLRAARDDERRHVQLFRGRARRALWTPVTMANVALSGNLLLSAIGVLVGGLLVGRTTRHGLVAALGLAGDRVSTALIAQVDLGTLVLIAAMTVAGFFSGVIMPSRDMIVREVTPPGSFGKVFGFVTTGFNIGGIISPLIFGAIMDHGSPRLVFLVVAAFSLIAIVTVATRPRRAA